MTAKTNHYCDRLDLPVPRLEEFVGRRDIKLFDLMVVALLEHGAPLSSELLAARLTAAGVEAATGDMAYSLKKAWHGMEPVYRDAEGRWGLNLSTIGIEIPSVPTGAAGCTDHSGGRGTRTRPGTHP